MDDKLRREFAHSQATVVRRPTFEQHPSTTSLGLAELTEAQLPAAAPPPSLPSPAYGRPSHGYAQPQQLVPPALYSYPSTSSAASASSSGYPPSYGRAPASFGSNGGGDVGRGLEDGLPAVYQPDNYAPAPLPDLYSSRSYAGSVNDDGSSAKDKTWGEAGHWSPNPGYGAVDDDKGPSAVPAWPPHLPRAGLAPGQQTSSQLPSAGPSPDYGRVRPGPRPGRLGSVGRTLRSLMPPSIPTRLFLALVLLQAVLVLAMLALLSLHYYSLQADDFRFLQATSEQRRLPVWLGVFALAHAWLFGMAIDGIRARNIIQIFGLAVFNLALLTYSIIQISEIRGVFDLAPGANLPSTSTSLRAIPVGLLSALIPAAIGAGEVGYLALAFYLYREFGWESYVALGADRRIKKAFEKYNVFQVLCKFDVFFFLGFSIQLVYLVLRKDWEFYVTIVALPSSLLLLALGWISARRELRSGMFAFLLGLLAGGVYFVYKTIRIWSNGDALETIVKSLTVFSGLSLALLLATSAAAIVVMRNFGQGLKEGLDRRRAVAKGEKTGRTGIGFDGGRAPLGRNPSDLRRMSIE